MFLRASVFFLTLCISLAIGSRLLAASPEAFTQVTLGETPVQVEEKLGKPDEAKPDFWRYRDHGNVEALIIRWRDGRVSTLAAHFKKPAKAEGIIPSDVGLVKIHQKNMGDVRGQSVDIGDPSAGRLWQVDHSRRVIAYYQVRPWKEKAPLQKRDPLMKSVFEEHR